MAQAKKPAKARTGKKITAAKKQPLKRAAVGVEPAERTAAPEGVAGQPKWYESFAGKAGRVGIAGGVLL